MKHYTYSFLLIVLLQNIAYSSAHQGDIFTFEISKNGENELLLETDVFSDDENAYDAVCDRVPSEKMPWWKRMVTQIYVFWYGKSHYLSNHIIQCGKNIKQYTIKWFLLAYNRMREIKK